MTTSGGMADGGLSAAWRAGAAGGRGGARSERAPPARPWALRLAVAALALTAWWALGGSVAVAQPPPPSSWAVAPVVDGAALETTTVAGRPVYYDPDVPADALMTAASAFEAALLEVPTITGLPPFGTPIAVYLLADEAQFRAALEQVGGVRVELVAPEVGGYAIERDGSMRIFFPARAVGAPAGATLGFAHELAHLAVREAGARRPVPQWLNEGYAQWASYAALRAVDPIAADEHAAIDRAVVASAFHGEAGLLPWASLVSRTRFSRAGTEGWGGLAYAQSALFVDWLATRHGVDRLAEFLRRIGGGEGATAAFRAAIGPFAPEEAAFRTSLEPLRGEYRPGLRRLTARPGVGRPVRYAIVGGTPGEQVTVEVVAGGAPVRRRDVTLDVVGFAVVALDAEAVALPGRKALRVSSPTFGLVEAGIRADGTFEDAAPRRAPVQLPDSSEPALAPAA